MSLSPGKKRKATPPTQFLSLPYDLRLNIVARVPRLYHPTLSLVSKSFRSLIASPELYKARSLCGRTDRCLYVCLVRTPPEDEDSDEDDDEYANSWFTLSRKPDQTIENDSSGFVLARVPIRSSPLAYFGSLVAVGSNIYNIAGSSWYESEPSSTVSILDCRTHTWREAPSLPVELETVCASVLDRKIYVAGRYYDRKTEYVEKAFEVFDTETQLWDPEHIPWSNKGSWGQVEWARCLHIYPVPAHGYCVIDNVLYSSSFESLKWYDTKVSMWRHLTGLVGLPNFPARARIRLADYGGRMAVFWEIRDDDEKMIWCAEIVLEKRSDFEIWGRVVWADHVLTVPEEYGLVKVLSVTV